MMLCTIYNSERIVMHPNDDLYSSHYVELTINGSEPKFAVTCCCDEEWIWEFMYSKTNYEMIKHIVMDTMFACDSMEEMIEELDDVFETEFMDIVWDFDEYDEDEPCDDDCEHCDARFE